MIDAASRPVGMLGRIEVVKHGCVRKEAPDAAKDRMPASKIMTHAVFVDAMRSLGVHRLLVLDCDGRALGVISALDVLRHLCR